MLQSMSAYIREPDFSTFPNIKELLRDYEELLPKYKILNPQYSVDFKQLNMMAQDFM